MSDLGVTSLPGVLKNLRKSMISASNGGPFPFIQIRPNRAVRWKIYLNIKGYPLMSIK